MKMSPYSTLLEETLEAWQGARQGVIAEVRNLGDKDLAFRPSPKSRSAAELALHIVEVGLMWCGELSRPDGDFTRRPYPRLIQEYAGDLPESAGRRAILALLDKSHRQGQKKLRQAGELLLLQYIRRFDGKQGTRLAWMNHGIAHEEYHRGQLALYARMRGRVPALTKLIGGE